LACSDELFAQAFSKGNEARDNQRPGSDQRQNHTLDLSQPEAEAVLVRNGRIVQVGSTPDVLSRAGGTKKFDAGGRTVVPGLIDAHTHFEMTCNAAAYQAQCHTPPFHSLREIFELLRSQVAKTPKGKWVVGRGSFDFFRIVEENRYPTRQELDAITMEHPLALYAGSMLRRSTPSHSRNWGFGMRPHQKLLAQPPCIAMVPGYQLV
jgi:hypothetical protein